MWLFKDKYGTVKTGYCYVKLHIKFSKIFVFFFRLTDWFRTEYCEHNHVRSGIGGRDASPLQKNVLGQGIDCVL